MVAEMVSQLEEFFELRTNGGLRSIIKYDQEGVDIVYLRDDVAEQYSEQEFATAVDEARMESMHAPIYERVFSGDHGDLQCMVNCFENVVEMNFALADGVGAAVALDARAMDEAHGLVTEARSIVVEERA